jgi:hypothetical protein
MLSCKEVTRLCSEEFERPLKLGEQASLRLHLVMCAGCANFRKQVQALHEAMRVYAQGGAPAGDAEARDERAP